MKDKKKFRYLFPAALCMSVVLAAGCGSKPEDSIENKEVFEEELTPIDEGEMEGTGETDSGDEEMTPIDEEDLTEDDEAVDIAKATAIDEDMTPTEEGGETKEEEENNVEEEPSSSEELSENQEYTSKAEVALYLHTYGHLPKNYLTQSEAREAGWEEEEDNLGEIAPGKSLGGDVYEDTTGTLPEKEGRTYYQCQVDGEDGKSSGKWLVYSSDGLIYYTEDKGATFEKLY